MACFWSVLLGNANRKRVYNFLLVHHSNLGPISHHFGDIAVFCALEWPHPYSTLILGMFPLHQITRVGVSPHIGLKLFGREVIFKEFQPMWSRYLNVTDGQMDRQTDGQHCTLGHTWIRSATSSQWKVWRRNWVRPRSYLPRFDTTPAAVLRTRCSSSVAFFAVPASRPIQ